MGTQSKKLALVTLFMAVGLPSVSAGEYTLREAIEAAQKNDPWLQGSVYRQENLEALSVSAGTLPDPKVSIGMINVPADNFDLNQEQMTQLKLGISQTFPRGKTLSLNREKLLNLSQAQPYLREDRKAKVAVTVSDLWLETFRHQKTIALIEDDRNLFEHLVDVAQSNYATASGRTRQQDFIRAQLELTRLEDRLSRLKQNKYLTLAKLSEWLPERDSPHNISMTEKIIGDLTKPAGLVDSYRDLSDALLAETIKAHPLIMSINRKLEAEASAHELAKQSYKPQWDVNATYGLRDDDALGNDRADFFSVELKLDVPLFTAKRQDKRVQAASAKKEAMKTERILALRKLRSGYLTAESNYRHLLKRKALYQTRLLKEMSEQAEASLSAYSNDDGDFSEVVRARIGELNARIDALNISVDIKKTIASLEYYLHAATLRDKEKIKRGLDISSVHLGDENE